MKFCQYCTRWRPKEGFVSRSKGKFGRTKVRMCEHCDTLRKDPVKFKENLPVALADSKAARTRRSQMMQKGKE